VTSTPPSCARSATSIVAAAEFEAELRHAIAANGGFAAVNYGAQSN
jgi:hypothetical protein